MRFREIKEGQIVAAAWNHGGVLITAIVKVVSKRTDNDANIIEVVDDAGVVFTVVPRDIERLAVASEVTAFETATETTGNAQAAAAEGAVGDALPVANADKPNNVRVIRYVRPKQKTNGKVCPIGNMGVTLVFDIDHAKNELTIYHSECNGETFSKERGIEEALKKKPEVFPFNRNHTLVGHVVYIVTKAKRRKMAHLQQLAKQVKLAMETRRLA